MVDFKVLIYNDNSTLMNRHQECLNSANLRLTADSPTSSVHKIQRAPRSVVISSSARVEGHLLVFEWNTATLA